MLTASRDLRAHRSILIEDLVLSLNHKLFGRALYFQGEPESSFFSDEVSTGGMSSVEPSGARELSFA